MGRIRIAGSLAVVMVLSVLMAGNARAQGSISADCTIAFTQHFSSGFILPPSSGTEGTGGGDGVDHLN